MPQEVEADWKAKYEALRLDYLRFLESMDGAGFQIQGFAKNKKAELLGERTSERLENGKRDLPA